MPRLPRIEFAGIPQHVVQRGNDRQPCFLGEADYHRYLRGLQDRADAPPVNPNHPPTSINEPDPYSL